MIRKRIHYVNLGTITIVFTKVYIFGILILVTEEPFEIFKIKHK